jgi:hypothetical protein
VIGRVAPWSVDALGVVVEASAGVDEDEHRGRVAVGLGVVVDHADRVAGA